MANYPASLPVIPANASNLAGTGAGEPHTVIHNALADELEAMALELGVSPSSTDATVAARLARIDALVVVDSQAMTLASGVTNTGLPFSSAYTFRSGSVIVAMGSLTNSSGSSVPAGTVIAQVTAAHYPIGTLKFMQSLGGVGATIRLDIALNGQISTVGSAWAIGEQLSVSGMVWAKAFA